MMKKPLIPGTLIGLIAVFGFSLAINRPPALWRTADQQGDRWMARGNYEAAAKVYEDPFRQGAAHYRVGNFKEAAAAFSRVDDAESAYNRGDSLMLLGKYDDAISSFDRALQFEPDWNEALANRQLAVARKELLNPPEDDAGGTGGQLEADEIVFDDRAKNSSQTDDIEVGQGEKLSDAEMRAMWLKNVQTKPGDFLRSKFAYQYSQRSSNASTPSNR